MTANPFLGVVLHAIGGVAHGSFYAPLRKVKQWSWETGWLVQGLAAWVLTPWIVAWITGAHPLAALRQSPSKTLLLAYLFGMMWGCGSLTFGLTMRYLGMSLGMAVALGYCAAFGTLIPPLVQGSFGMLLSTTGGWMVLAGVAVCLAGIGLCGYAGICKERELTLEQQSSAISEFSSWSIHLAFVIVFSTICGLLALEWKGVSRKTMGWVVLAILILIVSTVVTGFGNAMATK